MSAPRILILTNRIPYPLKDGGAMAMDAMIRGYHEAGWEVFLLAMNTSRHSVTAEKVAGLYGFLHRFETVDVNNEIRLLPVLKNFFFSRQPEHADRFTNPQFESRLIEVLQSFRPDVIQMESIYLSVYLPAIKEHSEAFTIQRLHNIEYQIWERLAAETSRRVKRFYLKDLAARIRRFEQEVWQQFDLLLPITEADAEMIEESGCDTEMRVTPFGISFDKLNKQTVREDWVGYHIGAMDWLPNAEAMEWLLREIWPLIHERCPKFQFYFAGRKMHHDFKENLPEGVHCLGEIPDAYAFIADKKILIVPLRSAGGIRVKILEAMAEGKLVISTSVGMQGIEAQPGVHYIMANTPAGFADAVAKSLNDKVGAERIAANGRRLISERYNQKNIMHGLIGLLDNKLEKKV